MRSEIATGDIHALLERAADEESLSAQPRIVQVELAEILKYADLKQDVRSIIADYSWEVLEPLSAESIKGTILKRQEDGSIFASGPNPASETYIISGHVGDRPVNAIRLETIRDERLRTGGYRRGRGGTFISQLAVKLTPVDRPKDGRTVTISRAFASHCESDKHPILNSVDSNDTTSWLLHGLETRTGIFLLPASPATRDEMRLTVRLMFKKNSLGRFRLLVTHDEIAIPDPQSAAVDLLRRMHDENPGDYWVNLSLSQALARQVPPQFDEALRYDTAAVALRPNRPNSHYVLARQIVSSSAHYGRPIPEGTLRHCLRARELSDDESMSRKIADDVFDHGRAVFLGGETARAISYFRIAEQVDPKSVPALLFLSWTLVNAEDENTRKPTEAAASAKRALSIQPENAYAWGNLGAAHYRNNQLADARDALKRANELLNDSANWLYMAMTAKKLGNDDTANEYYNKAIAWIDARETVDELITRLRAEAEGVLGITRGTTAEKEPAQVE